MKDLGHLRYFLRLEVAYTHQGYLFSQQKYTSNLISHACLIDTHTSATPIELYRQFSISDGEPLIDLTLSPDS